MCELSGWPKDASMRPQHITAENEGARAARGDRGRASMRPQHITAENLRRDVSLAESRAGFNEAAAYHCGKQIRRHGNEHLLTAASMRPQHITAENVESRTFADPSAPMLQ